MADPAVLYGSYANIMFSLIDHKMRKLSQKIFCIDYIPLVEYTVKVAAIKLFCKNKGRKEMIEC